MPNSNYRKTNKKHNLLSCILTVVAMCGIYLLMKVTTLPAVAVKPQEKQDYIIDIIDTETLKDLQIAHKVLPYQNMADAPLKFEQKIQVENLIDDPLEAIESMLTDNTAQLDFPISSNNAGTVNAELQLAETMRGDVSSTISADADDFTTLASRKNTTPFEADGAKLRIAGGTRIKVQVASIGEDVRNVGEIENSKPDVTDEKVPLKDVRDLGADYDDLSPIYKELVAWMKKNPSTLSGVVKTFMGHETGDLSSKVRVPLQGLKIDIFLVCREEQYEIRICIVEDAIATLLIDKGFKKQSNYFRIGAVHKKDSGQIFSFGTAQESASDYRTVRFYQLFLSWWKRVKESESY